MINSFLWTFQKSLNLNVFFLAIFVKRYINENFASNTEISPNFLVWKFCGNTQFLHSFRKFAQNLVKNVLSDKISTPDN